MIIHKPTGSGVKLAIASARARRQICPLKACSVSIFAGDKRAITIHWASSAIFHNDNDDTTGLVTRMLGDYVDFILTRPNDAETVGLP